MDTNNYDQMNLDLTEKKSGIIVEKDVLTAYTYEDRFAVVPKGVKKINCDGNVFSTSVTERIILPNSVHLIKGVTGMAHLLSFEVPYGVKTIEERCFAGCGELMYITLPETVTRIKAGAFSGCSKLKSINIPESAATLKSDMFDLASTDGDGVIYPELTIYGIKDSAAAKYAAKYGFKFEEGLPEKVPAPRTENDPRYADEIIDALMENNDAMRSVKSEPADEPVVKSAAEPVAEPAAEPSVETVSVAEAAEESVVKDTEFAEPTEDVTAQDVPIRSELVQTIMEQKPKTVATKTPEVPSESAIENVIDFSDRLKAEFNIGVPWSEAERIPHTPKRKKGFFARLFGSKE